MTPSFEAMADAVMKELQQSLAEVVARLPGGIRRAVDLEKTLQIEKKLAWRIFRLSRSSSLTGVEHVPSRIGMAQVLDAAAKEGVPEAVAERVRVAIDAFEAFAETHCDNRAGLVSMVKGFPQARSDQFETRVRRSLFRAHAHVWGMQVQMQVRTAVFGPKPGGANAYNLMVVSGDVGLQRRRESEPLVVVRYLGTHADATPHNHGSTAARRPVQQALSLMPEFCSDPIPRMTPHVRDDGSVETEISMPTGRTGAVTLYSHQTLEDEVVDRQFAFDMFITSPTEVVIRDIMVPVGQSDPATARIGVYGRRAHPEMIRIQPSDLLAQNETVTYLGARDCAPPVDGAPAHDEAVRHALEKAGWYGIRFDVYRCRVEYPVLHTKLAMRVDRSA